MAQGKKANATRARICKVAAELFARNGYHATGMAELSDAVGLGRGAMYYHIDSKESILFEISRSAINQLIPTAKEILDSNVPAVEKIQSLARELVSNIAELRAEWVVFFREFTVLTGDRYTEIMQARVEYEEIWRKVMEEGAAAGEFVSVDPIAVKGLLGMFNYSYLWLDPNGELMPEDIARLFSTLLLDGIRPRAS